MSKKPTGHGPITTGDDLVAIETQLSKIYGRGVLHAFDKIFLLGKICGSQEATFRVEHGCIVMLPIGEKSDLSKSIAIFDLVTGTALYDSTHSIPGASYDWAAYMEIAKTNGNCGKCSQIHFPGFDAHNEMVDRGEPVAASTQDGSSEGAKVLSLSDAKKKKPPTFH